MGNDGHSQSSDDRNSGLSTHGKKIRFFGAIKRVPTSDGFKFVGQYLQLWTNDDSRISAKRESTNTQNLRVLLRIKCNVVDESDQYMTRSYLMLISCNTEQAILVAREAATSSSQGIVNDPHAGHTLHVPNKNCIETKPSS